MGHATGRRKRSDAVASILRVNRNEADIWVLLLEENNENIGTDVSEKALISELVTGDRVSTFVSFLVFVLSASPTNGAGTSVIIEAKGALHGVDGGDSCTVHVAGDWWTPVMVERDRSLSSAGGRQTFGGRDYCKTRVGPELISPEFAAKLDGWQVVWALLCQQKVV